MLARSLWTFDFGRINRVEVDPETVEFSAGARTDMDVQRLAMSTDGEVLVGSRGVRLDPVTLEELAPYQLPLSHPDNDFEGLDVAFGPDGRTVFTTSSIFPVETVQTVPARLPGRRALLRPVRRAAQPVAQRCRPRRRGDRRLRGQPRPGRSRSRRAQPG